MTFPQITIPDPAAVGKWLDEELPQYAGKHTAHYSNEWAVCHWHTPGDYIYARGETPEAVLAEIRLQLAQMDPLYKLRAEADKHGYCLMKLPTD
jgi:hypothetical protein